MVLSFICLLRSDEVVNLRAEDVTVLGPDCISVCLTSRKTAQFGASKPFILWRLPEEQIHLCPVRAIAQWVRETGIISGYLFRHISRMDCASTDNTKHYQSSAFLEAFRNSLIDIGQDPHAYGTHSLRRGGCQWLAKECRWPIPQICEWGGWAKDFTHLTIVRYLISWNDDMNEAREDFFNPNRPPNLKCHTCGRTCWHA
ncbi:hypothetical protein HYPSUDRAFT_143429 [Hypholoma sublateritium FD-334 SS-4]|uniref:Tyr recombinase domain-containing protein n=1 Tax=Hypholoma sublateritium (strain FD-334 SS-4) TaxID=945553 RepID=A0A0D2PI40_HYPSF|nr:hypothetical protein HYPSUDRAFT_143429 [Hypholoma sublateritium FD-334 SS-4]